MEQKKIIITDELVDWKEIEKKIPWKGILLGNGASISVWSGFGYNSLFSKAKEPENECLTPEDLSLFKSKNTTNFEMVLGDLINSKNIARILGETSFAERVEQRYESIRNALFKVVSDVHVPWSELNETMVLSNICKYLETFDSVFSTNYDLLLYWSFMEKPSQFTDFFFDGSIFDITNTEIENRTKIHYLHGAVHLFRGEYGQVGKISSSKTQSIIELLQQGQGRDEIPLFVAEGTSQEKMSSIRSCDYLSFSLNKFSAFQGSTIIFGSALELNDVHLLNAICHGTRKEKNRKIAISVYPGMEPEAIIGLKNRLQPKLLNHFKEENIFFFDSTTHPLGDMNLNLG